MHLNTKYSNTIKKAILKRERDEIRDEIGLINSDKLKRQTYLRERDQNDELIKKRFIV